MAGRPTTLTPEVQERVCEALRQGHTRKAAATFAGIGYDTLQEWMARGRGTDDRPQTELYARFADAVAQADEEGRARLERRIVDASEKDWKAASYILERRFPEDWGKRVELTGKDGGPIQHAVDHKVAANELSTLPPDLLQQYAALAEALTRGPASGVEVDQADSG